MRRSSPWLVGFLLVASSANSGARQQSALPAADGPRLPEIPAYARPDCTALEVNAKLKSLYEEVSAAKPDPASQVSYLIALLKRLDELNDLIQRLGPGLGFNQA
jgi:hypothetical protein